MSAILPTYARFNLAVSEASGSIVKDTNNKEYIDFGSGIGVNNLGHRHPAVHEAVAEQLEKYWHVSNLYTNPIQEEVAALLKDSSGKHVFFSNSGAEANEAAIKLARKATGKNKILSFKQSFHGRTFATMSATGQSKIKDGFGTMLHEFVYLPFNDVNALKEAIDQDTAAIMLEVIQGEGGVIPADPAFINEVEDICNNNDILLMVDEIQTGIGRTGKLYGYEHYQINPDIITLAKGLGNGLPVGAMVANDELKDFFGPGSHGSTFGGNPLAMAASKAVLNIVNQADFLQAVEAKGSYLIDQLKEKIGKLPIVKDVRGLGLMVGIEYKTEVLPIVQSLLDKGILVLNAGPHVIRLLPPLTCTEEEIDQVIDAIFETSNQLEVV